MSWKGARHENKNSLEFLAEPGHKPFLPVMEGALAEPHRGGGLAFIHAQGDQFADASVFLIELFHTLDQFFQGNTIQNLSFYIGQRIGDLQAGFLDMHLKRPHAATEVVEAGGAISGTNPPGRGIAAAVPHSIVAHTPDRAVICLVDLSVDFDQFSAWMLQRLAGGVVKRGDIVAFLEHMDRDGCARIEDIVEEFSAFYEDRVRNGLPAEKRNCIFTKGGYSQKDVEKLILSMPFKRFEDMSFMHHARHLGVIQLDRQIAKRITDEDISNLRLYCESAISKYFSDLN